MQILWSFGTVSQQGKHSFFTFPWFLFWTRILLLTRFASCVPKLQACVLLPNLRDALKTGKFTTKRIFQPCIGNSMFLKCKTKWRKHQFYTCNPSMAIIVGNNALGLFVVKRPMLIECKKQIWYRGFVDLNNVHQIHISIRIFLVLSVWICVLSYIYESINFECRNGTRQKVYSMFVGNCGVKPMSPRFIPYFCTNGFSWTRKLEALSSAKSTSTSLSQVQGEKCGPHV